MNIADLDPSMLLGFLIKDETDWITWKEGLGCTSGKPLVTLTRHLSGDHWKRREGDIVEIDTMSDEEGLQ